MKSFFTVSSILAMIIFNGFTLPIYGLTIALFSCRCPLLQLVTRRTHIAAATHNFNHLWKKVVYILHPNYDYMPVKSAREFLSCCLLLMKAAAPKTEKNLPLHFCTSGGEQGGR